MTSDGILEHIGDALINAFSRIKKPDERFEELKENIETSNKIVGREYQPLEVSAKTTQELEEKVSRNRWNNCGS